MTPEQVRAISDRVGGTKAMAKHLGMSERAVRYMLQRGVRKTVMVRAIKGLVKTQGGSRRARALLVEMEGRS